MRFCSKSEFQVPVTLAPGWGLSKYEQTKSHLIRLRSIGSTENARHETKAQSKSRGGNCEKGNDGTKMQGWKLRHKDAGVENA